MTLAGFARLIQGQANVETKLKYAIVIAVLMLFGAEGAMAQCQGSDRTCVLDASDAEFKILIPATDADGDAFPLGTIATCAVNAPLIGWVVSATGAPAATVSVPGVPKGSSTDLDVFCTFTHPNASWSIQSLFSEVTMTQPGFRGPTMAPGLLP